jgi:hypothetical protein
MEEEFRHNWDILLSIGDCHLKNGNSLQAYYAYSQVRKVDPDAVDHMDKYAALLKSQGKVIVVNK